MLDLALDTETRERLSRLARKAGQTESEFARNALREFLLEREDAELAQSRLQEPSRTYSADEVKRELGL